MGYLFYRPNCTYWKVLWNMLYVWKCLYHEYIIKNNSLYEHLYVNYLDFKIWKWSLSLVFSVWPPPLTMVIASEFGNNHSLLLFISLNNISLVLPIFHFIQMESLIWYILFGDLLFHLMLSVEIHSYQWI